MKLKILTAIATLAILALTLPVSAYAANPPKLTKYKAGDDVVFGNNVVGKLQSIDSKTGKGTFKTTIEAPVYLDDLKTTVKTNWLASGGSYVTKDNLFKATVKDNTVEVKYGKESIKWTSDLWIGNKLIKYIAPIAIDDPVNENYGWNTLTYIYYSGGIQRYLRQIEGVLMDYYVIDSMPDGNITIKTKMNKTSGYVYDTAAYAYDAAGKPIKIMADDSSKTVMLADLKDAKFPITIDPTNNYVTRAGDGSFYPTNAYYATVHNLTTTFMYSDTGTAFRLGQRYNSGAYEYEVNRAAVYFDTSDLPDDAVISAATLSLRGYGDYSDTDFDITVTNGMPSYPHYLLDDGDYQLSLYTDGGGTLSTAGGFSTSSYNDITLSATGRGWINKTGDTKFMLMSNRDIAGTTPSGYEMVYPWAYEKGVGYWPKLDITYTATIPTVETDAATDIAGTTATLNGEITATGGENADMWGFVWDTDTHGDPGNAAPPSTYSDNKTYTGSEGLGTFDFDATGLTKGTQYFTRAFSHNSGGYGYGNEVNFTTIGDPVIEVKAPTAITTATARLQAELSNSGGDTCQVRWGYGLSDEGNDIEAYDTYTAYSGAWDTSSNPYLDISSLAADTTYYFNVEADNGIYTATGTSDDFNTESSVGNVSNVIAVPTDTTVNLSWVRGTGASETKVRFAINTCPSDNTTGTEIYSGTAATYIHTGLVSGTDYCYWLKGYDSVEGYSSTAVIIHCTTLAGTTAVTTGTTPGLGEGFISDPDSTSLQAKFPGDPVNKAIAESIEMPIDYFYFAGAMFLIILLCFGAFIISREPIAPAAVCALCMAIGGWQGIIPPYLAWGLGIIALAVIILKSRSVV
jgi:hypothetical protein